VGFGGAEPRADSFLLTINSIHGGCLSHGAIQPLLLSHVNFHHVTKNLKIQGICPPKTSYSISLAGNLNNSSIWCITRELIKVYLAGAIPATAIDSSIFQVDRALLY